MTDKRIRPMVESDRETVLAMMETFYASPAVINTGGSEIYNTDIDNCVGDSPYVDGYIIEVDGQPAGYTMIARSYSTEFGGKCIWIEDIYLEEDYRGMGLSSLFFHWLFEQEKDAVAFRLEVEKENENAVRSYDRNGFEFIEYNEMIRHA